jgi:hypothetical protein
MRRQKPAAHRNRLDLADRVQVGIVRKRLKVSEPKLKEIVSRIGNSISAISKEIAGQRSACLTATSDVPPAAIIDATKSEGVSEIHADAGATCQV